MGSFSIWHWLVVLAVVLLLFGGSGKISNLMGDVARGIKSFKSNIREEPDASMEAQATTPAQTTSSGTIAGPAAAGTTTAAHAAAPPHTGATSTTRPAA